MNFFKLRKILTSTRKRHKLLFAFISGISFLLLMYLAGVVFGIDQFLIKTPVEGTVSSQDGRPVSEAEVVLQGYKLKTDSNGMFKFEDINFGTYEITIEKNGFVRYNEKIKIKRFSNYLNVSLKPQEYGEVKIIFKTDRTIEKNLEVKINGQPFSVQAFSNEFIVNPDRLLVGNYLLEITSPDFVDFSEKFNLKSGNSELIYNLEPSGDVVAEFRDYLSENLIKPEEIIITVGNEVVDLTETESPSKFELKDVSLNKEYKISSKLTGYLPREVIFKPKQGLNSLSNIYMFVNDYVIYSDEEKIISSFIDNTNRKELYSAANRCKLVMTKVQYSLFSCNSNYLLYEKSANDYKLVREYVFSGSQYDLNTENLHLIVLSTDLKSILQIHSSINDTILLTHNKDIDSIVVDNSGTVYFSDSEAVFKNNGGESQKIVDGNYRLEKTSPDNNLIFALGNRYANQSNIWQIDINSKVPKKLTFLPNEYTELGFENPEIVYYMIRDGLYSGSVNNNNFVKITDSIDSYSMNEGADFIQVTEGGSVKFVSKFGYNKKPLFTD